MSHTEKFFFKGGNYFFWIVVIFLLFSTKAYSNGKLNEYPYLTDILDEYYWHHLKAPDKIVNVIEFSKVLYDQFPEQISYYNILNDYTFPKLLREIDAISFIETDCGFKMYIGNIEIYNNTDSPCCDSIASYYEEEKKTTIKKKLEKVFFFKKDGSVLFESDSVLDEYLEIKKKVDAIYIFDHTQVFFLIFENEVELFCNEDGVDVNVTYFTDLKQELDAFLKKYKLKKILFYSYYPISCN